MSTVSRINDLAGAIAAWIEKLRPVKIVIVIDGGGAAITAGHKLTIPDLPAGVLLGWTLVADATGSVQLDLKKAAYAGWPTTTSIAASAKPTLAAARKNTAASLAGWTTAVTAGDLLDVVVDSAATVTWVCLTLRLKRA